MNKESKQNGFWNVLPLILIGDIENEKEKYRQRIDAGWESSHQWSDNLPKARTNGCPVFDVEEVACEHASTVHSTAEDAAFCCTMDDVEIL